MITAPILHTDRLILRSFTLEDAADVQRLTSNPDVASTTDVNVDLIYADYSKRNPASGRVMQKIGMHYAYDLSEDDMIRYRILKSEFAEK